jgi:hypothetical protein
MGIIVRILGMIVAYWLACIAASLVLTIGTLTPVWDDFKPFDLQSVVLWSVVGVGAVFIGAIAMLPALLVIALAEGFAWRSILVYAVLALALSYGLDFGGEREVLAASGIAGGLVYWLIAGRRAGFWKA